MKFKSIKKRVYLAAASLLYLILADTGILKLSEADFMHYVDLLAIILVGFGVVTSPEKEVSESDNEDIDKQP